MIAPPVGLEVNSRADRTVTEKVLVADVQPVFENVNVTLYVPGVVGVPVICVPLTCIHDAPDTTTEQPDSFRTGLYDQVVPTMQ
jgi:hypothetical protein